MAEMMLFPETWEEFEKHYGFYDSKYAYMYGNTRLIPSFRVEQWLNHLNDIKRKNQLQKNKMEQIAAMFGKELGERFNVQDGKTDGLKTTFLCCFYTDRFESEIPGFKWSYQYNDAKLLISLIGGKAEIVEDEK